MSAPSVRGEGADAVVVVAKSPIATLGTKHLLNYSRDHTVDEGLQYTKVWWVLPSPVLPLFLTPLFAGTWSAFLLSCSLRSD